MNKKIRQIAEKMIDMTDGSEDELDIYDYMEEQSKIHNVDKDQVFKAYTGLVSIRIMDVLKETDFDFICISKHKATKTITYGQTLDIDELAEVLSNHITLQSMLHKALEKAQKINLQNNQYIQLNGGEA